MKKPMRGAGAWETVGVIAFWGLLIWGATSLFGGDSGSSVGNEYYGDYDSGYYEEDYYAPEPENPYGNGTGHDAGFEWAEENDVDSCGGNSQSFIEGCEEYLDQQEAYEEAEYEAETAEYEDDYDSYYR
jgi:hypothetical protein